MLRDDSSIKERDRIVGTQTQGLAQVFVRYTGVFRAVFLLGPLKVSGGEIGE